MKRTRQQSGGRKEKKTFHICEKSNRMKSVHNKVCHQSRCLNPRRADGSGVMRVLWSAWLPEWVPCRTTTIISSFMSSDVFARYLLYKLEQPHNSPFVSLGCSEHCRDINSYMISCYNNQASLFFHETPGVWKWCFQNNTKHIRKREEGPVSLPNTSSK